MVFRKLRFLPLLLIPLFLLCACGEDNPAAHRVEVTVALQGSATETVQGVDLTAALPSGFSVVADGNGEPAAGTVTSLLGGALVVSRYLPTGSGSGGPALHIMIADATGFAANAALVRLAAVYPPESLLPLPSFFSGSADVSTIDSGNNTATAAAALTFSVAAVEL